MKCRSAISHIFRNAQNVESDGIELELKTRFANGLEGNASYSFQETKDSDTGQLLNNSPRHLGKVDLTETLLRRTLFASLNAQYRSGMTTLRGGAVSPFSIVNIDLFGRRISRYLDLSASLFNLLDKTDYDPPSTAVSEAAIQQDGRTFRAKMTWYLGER